jgi:hypothetical protein
MGRKPALTRETQGHGADPVGAISATDRDADGWPRMNTLPPPGRDDRLSRLAPILFAVLQVLTPLLPQAGIGVPIGERSDGVRTLVTPAAWAFSIWGALYTSAFVFAVYQALPAQRDNALVARLRWPAAGAFLGNATWALYAQSLGLGAPSSLIILFTLACLLTCYARLARWPRALTRGESWCAYLPLSALASWLTAASIVNIAASLRFHGVEGGDTSAPIAAAVIAVGGVTAAIALLKGRGNLPYALVFLWALAAIYAAGGQQAAPVAIAVVAAAALVVTAVLIGRRRSPAPG